MNYGSQVYRICKIMKKAGKPVNTHYVLTQLEAEQVLLNSTKKSIEVVMCGNRAYFNRSSSFCECCGKVTSYFSLNENGLIALAEVERCQLPMSNDEWKSFGINVKELI